MALPRRWIWIVAAGLMVTGLASATWRQTTYWKDTRALYEHAAAVDPRNYNAWIALGILSGRERRFADEIAAYRRVLGIKPGHLLAQRNLALAHLRVGDHAEAYQIYLQLRKKDRAAAAEVSQRYRAAASRALPGTVKRLGGE